MIKISPSILASDFSMLARQIEVVEKAGADLLHIDVMDGHFVPEITIGAPVIRSIRKKSRLPFDVHLMIEQPENFISAFADAGADIITVHAEATRHLDRVVRMIKKEGKKAGVALNPATGPDVLDYVLDNIDMVLIMTVNPGWGGQKFIDGMIDKIGNLREKLTPDIDIEVDGGIDCSNAGRVIKAGANVIVAGTCIYSAVTGLTENCGIPDNTAVAKIIKSLRG